MGYISAQLGAPGDQVEIDDTKSVSKILEKIQDEKEHYLNNIGFKCVNRDPTFVHQPCVLQARDL